MSDASRLDRALSILGQTPDIDQTKAKRTLPTGKTALLAAVLSWIERTILERWLIIEDENGAALAKLRVGNRRLYQLDGSVRAGMMASANETLALGQSQPVADAVNEIATWLDLATAKSPSLSLRISSNTDDAPHSVGLQTSVLAAAWGQDVPTDVNYDGPEDPLAALLQLDLVQRQLWVLYEGDTQVDASERRGASDLAAHAAAARQVLLATGHAPGLSVVGVNQTDGLSIVAAFTKDRHLLLIIANDQLPALLSDWQRIMESG